MVLPSLHLNILVSEYNKIMWDVLKQNNSLRFGVAFLANVPIDESIRQFKHAEDLGFEIAGT
jgi:hypothetical protein